MDKEIKLLMPELPDNLREWVDERAINFSSKDKEHIVDCLTSIINWYVYNLHPGGFITSVLKNDLYGAFF